MKCLAAKLERKRVSIDAQPFNSPDSALTASILYLGEGKTEGQPLTSQLTLTECS